MLQRTPRSLVYLSADELGITPAERAGLIEVRDDLASGRMVHVPVEGGSYWNNTSRADAAKMLFNMEAFSSDADCGTAFCLAGFLAYRVDRDIHPGELSRPFNPLFNPRIPYQRWADLTTSQAVRAIDYFLSGSVDDCWPLALSDEPA